MNLFRLLAFLNKQKRGAELTSIMSYENILAHCKLSTLHQELNECCLLCVIREGVESGSNYHRRCLDFLLNPNKKSSTLGGECFFLFGLSSRKRLADYDVDRTRSVSMGYSDRFAEFIGSNGTDSIQLLPPRVRASNRTE